MSWWTKARDTFESAGGSIVKSATGLDISGGLSVGAGGTPSNEGRIPSNNVAPPPFIQTPAPQPVKVQGAQVPPVPPSSSPTNYGRAYQSVNPNATPIVLQTANAPSGSGSTPLVLGGLALVALKVAHVL